MNLSINKRARFSGHIVHSANITGARAVKLCQKFGWPIRTTITSKNFGHVTLPSPVKATDAGHHLYRANSLVGDREVAHTELPITHILHLLKPEDKKKIVVTVKKSSIVITGFKFTADDVSELWSHGSKITWDHAGIRAY